MQSRIAFAVLTIAMCTALTQDAMCVDIVYPSAEIDSNTTVTPVVDVKNNGSDALPNVPVSFNIVWDSEPTDTIFYDTANSGQIGAGATKRITFAGSCTPEPGYFTMTCITELPGDTNHHNDTCTKSLFVIHLDVGVEIVSPRDTEEPGIVPMVVKLTNIGNVPATVPRLDVTSRPSGLYDYRENIAIAVGANQVVSLSLDLPQHGEETCTAWITYPQDMNHYNDTDVVIVHTGPFPGVHEDANTRASPSPSRVAGSIARVDSRLIIAGAASVTLFDIRGRTVLRRNMSTADAGEVSLDLRKLSAGVYLVRLDDGRSAVTRKLVVQR